MFFFDTVNQKYYQAKNFANQFYEQLIQGMPDFSAFHGELSLIYTKTIIDHFKNNYLKYGVLCSIELLGYIIDLNFLEGTSLSTTLLYTSSICVKALLLSSIIEMNRPVDIHLSNASGNSFSTPPYSTG